MVELIKNIDIIFKYFVPGYCFITLFLLLTDRTKYDIKHKILNSIILSVVFDAIFLFLQKILFPQKTISTSIVILAETILMSLLGIAFGKLTFVEKFSTWFTKAFKKSPHSSIWQDVYKPNKNSYCKMFLKDKSIICGYLQEIEMGKENPYFIVSTYRMRTDEKEISYTKYSEDSIMVVSINNIEKILVTYSEK